MARQRESGGEDGDPVVSVNGDTSDDVKGVDSDGVGSEGVECVNGDTSDNARGVDSDRVESVGSEGVESVDSEDGEGVESDGGEVLEERTTVGTQQDMSTLEVTIQIHIII